MAQKSIHSAAYGRLIENLRARREDSGLTQAELAEKLKRPQTWVSKIEVGERRLDLEELRQLCDALGVDLLEVVDGWLGSIPGTRRARKRRPGR